VVVEEADKHPKNGRYIWVTVAEAGSLITPKTPPQPNRPTKEIIDKFEPKLRSKRKTREMQKQNSS
jgi:hypothetical protein